MLKKDGRLKPDIYILFSNGYSQLKTGTENVQKSNVSGIQMCGIQIHTVFDQNRFLRRAKIT
jgi:hypothetical protein